MKTEPYPPLPDGAQELIELTLDVWLFTFGPQLVGVVTEWLENSCGAGAEDLAALVEAFPANDAEFNGEEWICH